MRIEVHSDAPAMGVAAAHQGAELLREALRKNSSASIILATGASQFETLNQLVASPDIDWARVDCFHLDEYAGMPASHPASFRRYLRERFVEQLPVPPRGFEYINAEGNLADECDRLAKAIHSHSIEVAFIGIGENGHLAFNDPPADFDTDVPYLVVDLDEACRQQQLGEGWFESIEQVPTQAISMSIKQILKSRHIICSVPDERKASAVKLAVEGSVDPTCPASILQTHSLATLHLDRASASELRIQQT